MSVADFLAKLKLSPRDAEVIFDRDEPVGRPTDLVLRRRHWFRRAEQSNDKPRAAAGNAS
jgi:hypothetical protein